MENKQFPLDLDNVHSVVEIGQVCIILLIALHVTVAQTPEV